MLIVFIPFLYAPDGCRAALTFSPDHKWLAACYAERESIATYGLNQRVPLNGTCLFRVIL